MDFKRKEYEVSSKIKKILACLLIGTMCLSGVPVQAVYAEENAVIVDSENSSVEELTESGIGEIAQETEASEENKELEDSSVEQSATELNENQLETVEQIDETLETQNSDNTIERKEIDYVYIESPMVQTPSTQRIVLGLTSPLEEGESISIVVNGESGISEEWPLVKNVDHLYLFEKEYADDTVIGNYYVERIIIRNANNEERSINLVDENISAEYGVNKEYDGIDELKPIDEEQKIEESVETSVVTIDENGVTEAQDSISEALEVVQKEEESRRSGFAFFSHEKEARTNNGNIVVALDPGHDVRDAGSHANGLKEEDLTLKIANYCKQELETYAGVSVYMTRTGPECPYDLPGIKCMKHRVQAAADAGAKIFVSFHLNASTSAGANGAEVIVPNSNWRPQVGSDGRALAEKIMAELAALGLTQRPIYSKDTTINEYYPDGSKSDYFSVQIYCKEQGIPGLIVEHAFLTNTNDVNKYLSTEEGLKKLGIADAKGIAKYLGLSKLSDRVAVSEGTYTISSALDLNKGLRIIGDSKADGAKTCLYTKNKNNGSQKFSVVSVGDRYYQIVAEHSGKALEVVKDQSGNTFIEQKNRNINSQAQKWYFINSGNGYYYLMSALGGCMDVHSGLTKDGTVVWAYALNQSKAQKWKLESENTSNKPVVNERPIANGTYVLANVANQNQVLDVTGASVWNEANIQTYQFNNTPAQQFDITYVGNGYYKIISVNSGKSLDVTYASRDHGANVWQYDWNGSDAQLWRFVDGGNGSYYIQSKLGTYLAAKHDFVNSGTNVQMSSLGNANKEKWAFKKAESRPISDGLYTIRSAGNRQLTLDISDASQKENANTWIYSYNGTPAQQFNVQYVKDGYYKIIANHSGKALSVVSDSGKDGVNVVQKKWDGGSDSQLWMFIKTDNGYFIRSKTGPTLDVCSAVFAPYSNVWTYSMNGSSAQKWYVEKEYPSVEIKNGVYTIKTALDTSKALDIQYASRDNTANAWIYEFNNTSAQKFQITAVSDGYYKIQSKNSGKVLDVAYASNANGANVWQYDWNGSDAQLWRFIDAGNGVYFIQSRLGTVLDVAAACRNSGTNVQTYSLNRSVAQKWQLDIEERDLYPIMGKSGVTVSQMTRFYKSKAKVDYPYSDSKEAPTIERFCEIYMEECNKEGVKVEVAFAQAMKETAFLKFGGDVKKEQYNFAGLGAVGGGSAGAEFDSIRTGIRAQVQHLKAYGSTEKLVNSIVDPRFQFVKRGTAKYVEWLGQKENPNGYGWATDKNYGYSIVEAYILPMKNN